MTLNGVASSVAHKAEPAKRQRIILELIHSGMAATGIGPNLAREFLKLDEGTAPNASGRDLIRFEEPRARLRERRMKKRTPHRRGQFHPRGVPCD
jgi:hypothetical protein